MRAGAGVRVGIATLALFGFVATGCGDSGGSGSGGAFEAVNGGGGDPTTTEAEPVTTTEATTTTEETTTSSEPEVDLDAPFYGEIVYGTACSSLDKTDGVYDAQFQVEANRGRGGAELVVEASVENVAPGRSATRTGTGELDDTGNGVVYIPMYAEDEIVNPTRLTIDGEEQEVGPGNRANGSLAGTCSEDIADD
jgi:hypothetical protein